MDEINNKLSLLSFPKKEDTQELNTTYLIEYLDGTTQVVDDEDVNFQIVPGINFLMFFKDVDDDHMQLIEAINLDTIKCFKTIEEIEV
jgi:hypothetical protein